MRDQAISDNVLSRAINGGFEGAHWGGALGLTHGLTYVIHTSAPWVAQIGGSLMAGIAIGAIVCCIGRAVSGKVFGACVGAVFGFCAGLSLGALFGGTSWIAMKETTEMFTSAGVPVGQMIGPALGALAGTAIGAAIDRRFRWSTGKPVGAIA